jgi:ribosomal protein L40E
METAISDTVGICGMGSKSYEAAKKKLDELIVHPKVAKVLLELMKEMNEDREAAKAVLIKDLSKWKGDFTQWIDHLDDTKTCPNCQQTLPFSARRCPKCDRYLEILEDGVSTVGL